MNPIAERLGRGKLHYRPDVDGLRALAVTAVIINHFNKSILPSGYLGVDIFFVISGYVITLSLINQSRANSYGFISGFYARRVKRLLPALIVFILASSFLICLVDPSPGASLRTGVAAIFGLSNLYLYKQSTDYFAETSEMNIFTHTWSLGIEEQFYLFYPLFFWFAAAFLPSKKNLFRYLAISVAILSFFSFMMFLYLWVHNPSGSYFLMPSRLWELGSGCLIAYEQEAKNSCNRWGKRAASSLILLAMVFVFFLPVAHGWLATPAMIILSVLLIRSLRQSTFAYALLTQQKVVLVGLISYSLYLWHWGILCLSRWTIGIHWWTIPIQILLMFTLAILSYHYIESPIRHAGQNLSNYRQIAWSIASSAFVGAAIGLGLYPASKMLFRLTSPEKSLDPLYTDQPYVPEKIAINTSTCSDPDLKKLKEAIQRCTLLPTSKRRMFYFVGDSQSNHLKALAGKLRQDFGYGSQLLAISSMPFPTGYYWISGKEDMRLAMNNAKIQQSLVEYSLDKANAGDIFVLSGRFIAYFSDYKIPLHHRELNIKRYLSDGKEASNQEALTEWAEKLDRFVKQAAQRNVNIVLMLPFPEFPYSGAQCISYFAKINPSPLCSQSRMGLNLRTKDFKEAVFGIAQINRNLYLFDPLDALCHQDLACKSTDQNGNLLFYDATHLSGHGARYLSADFIKFLIRRSLI
jgi:peptidoglycan/LPS O-acetylase OafA/YrhL